MKQREAFEIQGKDHLVCRVKKSIYGLKQSPHCWNAALDTYPVERWDSINQNMTHVSTTRTHEERCFILACMSMILFWLEKWKESSLKSRCLTRKFDIKNPGELNYFLEMKIEQRENSVWIGQPAYLKNLLETYGMQDCKLVDTQVSIGSKLNKASDEDECVDQKNTVVSVLILGPWKIFH